MKWRYSRDNKFRKKFDIERVKIVPAYTFFFFTEKQFYLAEDQIRKKKHKKLRMLFAFVHLSICVHKPYGTGFQIKAYQCQKHGTWPDFQCLASFSLREGNSSGKLHFLNVVKLALN